MKVPRREDYPGEGVFDGPVVYAIQNDFDYTYMKYIQIYNIYMI